MAIDTYSNIKATPAFSPRKSATGGVTGTTLGTVVDTAGYRSNTLIVQNGLQSASVTTCTPVVLSGTVTGTLTSAAAAEMIGTEAAAGVLLAGVQVEPGAIAKIGYIGTNRYIRADLIVAGASTGYSSAVWIQGDAIEPQ
jgi:hypothetical protein